MLEPGEPILLLREGAYSLDAAPHGATLEVWGDTKLLRRRITGIRKAAKEKLEVSVEKFARKTGTITLLDANAPSAALVERDATRSEDLAALCRWCERLFPLWRTEQSSCGTDLENSLSPRFPRALLRMGSHAMAVLSVPDAGAAEEALAFGLVWFKYAQSRWPAFAVKTLALFVPEQAAVAMGLRFNALRADLIQLRLFAVPSSGFPEERIQQSWGNLDSAPAPLGTWVPADTRIRALLEEVAARSDAELVEDLEGGLHLELRGMPLAICKGDRLQAGVVLREVRRRITAERLLAIVERVARIRSADSVQRQHALYRSFPERWLEGMVRRQIQQIDPLIDPATLRRQVTGFLGMHHSRTDLLALDREGRLVILEIKAAERPAHPGPRLLHPPLPASRTRGDSDKRALPGQGRPSEPAAAAAGGARATVSFNQRNCFALLRLLYSGAPDWCRDRMA
ncbi:MAG: hypothetical protein U5J83_18875 [Bryobacterales bacterium]|nr:hypothetical protein [Bryobacterales bacterium]